MRYQWAAEIGRFVRFRWRIIWQPLDEEVEGTECFEPGALRDRIEGVAGLGDLEIDPAKWSSFGGRNTWLGPWIEIMRHMNMGGSGRETLAGPERIPISLRTPT
jgi:hypothetical protein